jgi:hypothetical protein
LTECLLQCILFVFRHLPDDRPKRPAGPTWAACLRLLSRSRQRRAGTSPAPTKTTEVATGRGRKRPWGGLSAKRWRLGGTLTFALSQPEGELKGRGHAGGMRFLGPLAWASERHMRAGASPAPTSGSGARCRGGPWGRPRLVMITPSARALLPPAVSS